MSKSTIVGQTLKLMKKYHLSKLIMCLPRKRKVIVLVEKMFVSVLKSWGLSTK